MRSVVYPIFQSMVAGHNIAGIESHDEYEALHSVRPRAEWTLVQGHQETNNQGAKAFRDRARELIMPFFVQGDGTQEDDEKFIEAKQA